MFYGTWFRYDNKDSGYRDRRKCIVDQFNTRQVVAIDEEEPPLTRGDVLSSTSSNDLQTSWNRVVPRSHNSASMNKTKQFRKAFFPDATNQEWNDWHWQLSHRITTLEQITRYIDLTLEERQALELSVTQFPFSVTPYYLSLINLQDQNSALRKTVIPSIRESFTCEGESDDPLHEENTSPVPGIVHRYPDRVLFLTTSFCSVYCRYCTRSRLVGGHSEALEKHWKEAIEYIRNTPVIRDVVISGGDPLTLSDERIEYLLTEIFSIPHIEMVRIGTKVPVVLPQRITPQLLKILKRFKPLYLSVHCTHPDEITEESAKAFNNLADAGVVMGSQSVLLKGVNDSVETLTELYHQLLKVRVKPYYLFQCDPISGSAHFRTTVAKGKELIHGLRGFTSGYAIPQYVIDTPGGGGKVPILPEYEVGHDAGNLYLRNYEGRVFAYPDRAEEGTEN
ncbi:KamA family protein [Sphaerochaeta pleomorpha str. Grapes]|uniref:L-lysine 2,3-aminomutase n=1 Tax=Sphaerochaeta pleomorpha (strain ATCC BAA-1885 / DSM 22778 / Grapes) TaxID=158190 RepID=G8QR96_SPHPG|nr:KamA family protein [Sphaerochaeta pleomorpha str. Grapes]